MVLTLNKYYFFNFNVVFLIMKYFLFAFLVLLAWFVMGSWIYLCSIKGLCADNRVATPLKTTNTSVAKDVYDQNHNNASGDIRTTTRDTVANEALKSFETRKVIYFDFDSDKYQADHELESYITDLKSFLNAYPERKIHVIGHTDNVGETSDNEWIGMQRAKNAMQYLIAEGISENRILPLSKGEAEPITSNTTNEGRRQNRRVEIIIN